MCTLLKVVSPFDLNVLKMSVLVSKKIGSGVDWWSELNSVLFWIIGFFLTSQCP